jgi:hypothetical protein
MDADPLNFEEARRKRDANPSLVPCARCGKCIVATATRCPECGVHFAGQAQDFSHPSEFELKPVGVPKWVVALAVLTLFALLVGLLWR